MKGNSRHPSVPPPPPAPQSPTSKATAKYTNKDGSKFITVPKGSTPADSAQPSPTITTAANAAPGPQSTSTSHTQGHGQGRVEGQVQPINKKKAKRRQKAAAKAAATQGVANSAPLNGFPSPSPSNAQQSTEADHDDSHDERPEDFNDHRDSHTSNIHENGFAQGAASSSKKSKKKKKKGNAGQTTTEPPHSPHHDAYVPAPHLSQQQRSGISKEKIWNTSSQEERERIKEFWLGLSETERKDLVRVEKDAVLKKMKEQQKHTCSCTVCGRKRTAIEEELEGLYDAYYEELEQYANHPNQGEAPPMLGRRPSFSSMTGMRPRGLPTSYRSHHQPSHGQIVDHGAEDDEEEEVEEEYSEDEQEEDDYSDDEPSEELHRSDYPADFFNFGNSLTVQGGILTVADDLLKNDGKKFIEMMEQLAERRMAREEDAREQFTSPFPHTNGADRNAHYHPPADDEVDDDDEYDDDDDEYDNEDEEDYDSQDEEETMTEEQRMEEGRRMFQIFAARMFEQRVLTAYREKVARERQNMLLEEIDAEIRRTEERQVKKQKEAQKKKERQARQKKQQAEEKARREEEKIAEEKAKKAEEDRQKELRRQREEEKRKQKEAQKKAEEEERKRKEAERQRRNQEREENERKAREAREREKKAREEARLKEKEAREQKEKEAREQKEQQERDKREKEAKAKADMEAAKAAKEKSKQEDRAAQKAVGLATTAPMPITLPKRPAQPSQSSVPAAVPAAVPALPQQPAAYASPVIAVATPAFPKAPAPAQSRPTHQQESVTTTSSGSTSQPGSAASQNPSPHTLTPVHTSPGPMNPPSKPGIAVGGTQSSGMHLPSPAPSTILNMGPKSLQSLPNPFGGPSMNMPFQPTPQPPPGFSSHMQPQYPPFYNPANSYNRVAPGMNVPPGFPAPPGFPTSLGQRAMSMQSSGFPGSLDSPMSSFAGLSSLIGKDSVPSHARQGSGSFETGLVGSSSQPISRPTPIGRPASVVHGQRRSLESSTNGTDKTDPDVHLGSSALLEPDDTQQDFPARSHFGLLGTSAPGLRSGPGFGAGPFGMEPGFPLAHQNNPWSPSLQHNPFVQTPPGFPNHGPWSQAAPPGIIGRNPSIVERSAPRSVTLRKALCAVCEELGAGGSSSYDGYIPLEEIMVHMRQGQYTGNEKEVLDICDTEGNPSNGGGSFVVREPLSPTGTPLIRYVPDDDASRAPYHPIKHPGDIGSPIVGSGSFNVRS